MNSQQIAEAVATEAAAQRAFDDRHPGPHEQAEIDAADAAFLDGAAKPWFQDLTEDQILEQLRANTAPAADDEFHTVALPQAFLLSLATRRYHRYPTTDDEKAAMENVLAAIDRRKSGDPEALELAWDGLRGVLGILADGELRPDFAVASVICSIGEALSGLADLHLAATCSRPETGQAEACHAAS
jgi:hypothetical protein